LIYGAIVSVEAAFGCEDSLLDEDFVSSFLELSSFCFKRFFFSSTFSRASFFAFSRAKAFAFYLASEDVVPCPPVVS